MYDFDKYKLQYHVILIFFLNLLSCLFFSFFEQEIVERAKESQKHNEHVHYLGPGGYIAKRTKWCVHDPVSSLNDSESVNASILSSERSGRSYDWVKARTKPQEGGVYYFPKYNTKEVFDKMVIYLIILKLNYI